MSSFAQFEGLFLVQLIIFGVTAALGYGFEGYLPGGPMISGALSCFISGDLAYLATELLGKAGRIQTFGSDGNWDVTAQGMLWIGIAAAIGCLIGMVVGPFLGLPMIVGPIFGGIGAVLAYSNRVL